ncbi:hypothetical protein ADUPG1_005656, partial [Aduncisulcus paluster]
SERNRDKKISWETKGVKDEGEDDDEEEGKEDEDPHNELAYLDEILIVAQAEWDEVLEVYKEAVALEMIDKKKESSTDGDERTQK